MGVTWFIKDSLLETTLANYLINVDKNSTREGGGVLGEWPHKTQKARNTSLQESEVHFLVTDCFATYETYKYKILMGFFIENLLEKDLVPAEDKDRFTIVRLPLKCSSFFNLLTLRLSVFQNLLEASAHSFKIGYYSFDAQARSFIHETTGEKVTVTEKESQLLHVLNTYGGKVVPKKELLQIVWSYGESISTRTLESHIYSLRRKIEELTGESCLYTEKGGYRLCLS